MFPLLLWAGSLVLVLACLAATCFPAERSLVDSMRDSIQKWARSRRTTTINSKNSSEKEVRRTPLSNLTTGRYGVETIGWLKDQFRYRTFLIEEEKPDQE